MHSTDLFGIEVTFEKAAKAGTGKEEWQEKTRRVLADTGALGQYKAFEEEARDLFSV